MINDESAARAASESALSASHLLDESLRQVMSTSSEEEVEAYRTAVAHLMNEIREQVLDPIYARHPSLVPESWRSWYTPRQRK